MRSYYAVQGDYHFVTSSRALVTRFLRDGRRPRIAGRDRGVPHARARMPLERADSVLIYFSDAFFQNLTSPRYRIEMLRRLQAATDIEVVMLAKLAAATEGKPGGTIEELVGGGMLPPGFGPRPDGSRAVLAGGEVYDQLRGRRHRFIPVPGHARRTGQPGRGRGLSPLRRGLSGQVGPHRADHGCLAAQGAGRLRRSRIVLDLRMTPLDRRRVAMLGLWAGPADPQRLAAVPGNLAACEAVLPGQRLFLGLRDVVPPLEIPGGRFFPWQRLRDTVIGYLGHAGQPGGLLAVLDATFPPPQPNGMSKNLFGLWRLVSGRFVLYSFQPDVLTGTAPQLRFEAAPRPAQLWLHVADPSAARMTPFLNDLGYARTRQTTLGNLRLLATLHEQLHMPLKDCKEAAELLLGAKLICPLGGKYVLRDAGWPGGRLDFDRAGEVSESAGRAREAPPGYVAPPLSWLRGLDLDAALEGDTIAAHADVLMQKPAGK